MATIVIAATCRLDRLVVAPQGALLCVTPSLPDTLRDSAAGGSVTPRSDTLGIGNCGGGELRWRASVKPGSTWLSVLPDSGVVGHGGAPQVLFNPTSLDTGIYRETIIINTATGNGVADVPVEFTVHPCRIAPIRLDDSASATLTSADCGAPHRAGRFARTYGFPGTANDSVSLELVSDYAAYLVLDTTLSAARPSLAESDGCLGAVGEPCLYYQRLPYNGAYEIEVTSAAVGDSGSYTLRVVHPRLPNVPSGLDQRLSDSVTSVVSGATVHQSSLLLRAVVTDPDLGDSLHLEAEVRPLGVAFSAPNLPNGPAVGNGEPAWVGVSGLSDKTSYHWRVRAGDNTGRTGSWSPFGGSPDFVVNILHAPNPPTTLGQAQADGTGLITGGTTDSDVVILGAVVSDSDPGDLVRLEVEVRPVGTTFVAATDSSAPVANGGALQVTVGPLAGSTSYHWRTRAVDQTGLTSGWVSYGGNAESASDFTVTSVHEPGVPSALVQLQSRDLTPIPVGGQPQSDSVVIQGTVTDPDAGQSVLLDVEVQAVGQAFTDQPNYSSGFVRSGAMARAIVGPLATNSGYHWQARARDNTGNIGAWVSFPINPPNPETEADFAYPVTRPVQLVFIVQPTTTKAGKLITPPVQVAAADTNGQTVTSFAGTVMMTLAPNLSGAMLQGTTVVTAVAGVATFSNLKVNHPGLGLQLRATTTQPSLTVLSAPFTVTR